MDESNFYCSQKTDKSLSLTIDPSNRIYKFNPFWIEFLSYSIFFIKRSQLEMHKTAETTRAASTLTA